jgi:hypothetical protein
LNIFFFPVSLYNPFGNSFTTNVFYILFLELCKSNRWHTYVSQKNQISFIRWKGVPTQNIMTTCSFDMQFTFVWAGWEGSAHDTRIFHETIYNPNIKFPKLP